MTERPILFSAPMVRAILDGRKTQTRRPMKPQPRTAFLPFQGELVMWHPPGASNDLRWPRSDRSPSFDVKDGGPPVRIDAVSPYGSIGDRLWVRETWQHSNSPLGPYDTDCTVFYRADYLDDAHGPDGEKSPEGKYRDWRPSIHMPRSAARLLLEVTGIRVERLNDCSEADAIAEGVTINRAGGHFVDGLLARHASPVGAPAVLAFRSLWESINGAGAWEANPWVWVLEFRRVAP